MDHFEARGGLAALPCVLNVVALQHDGLLRGGGLNSAETGGSLRAVQLSSAEEHPLHCLMSSHGSHLAAGLKGPARRGAVGTTSRGFSAHSRGLSTDGEV